MPQVDVASGTIGFSIYTRSYWKIYVSNPISSYLETPTQASMFQAYANGEHRIVITDLTGKTFGAWMNSCVFVRRVTDFHIPGGGFDVYRVGLGAVVETLEFSRTSSSYTFVTSRIDLDPSPSRRRTGEQWATCARCGFTYPLSKMSVQDGLEVCIRNCVFEKGRDYYTRLSRVPLERDPEQLVGDEESE